MRIAYAITAAALLLVACDGGKAPPAQQAARSLAEAREDIDKARAAIQATEQQSKALQEKIQAQRAELSDLVEQRLALLRQQRPDDKALEKRSEEVRARLKAYREAPPDKAREALAALERSLAELKPPAQ
jgi:septal ring factor EnvC (AmiA/AmiB activator)